VPSNIFEFEGVRTTVLVNNGYVQSNIRLLMCAAVFVLVGWCVLFGVFACYGMWAIVCWWQTHLISNPSTSLADGCGRAQGGRGGCWVDTPAHLSDTKTGIDWPGLPWEWIYSVTALQTRSNNDVGGQGERTICW